MPPHAGVAHGRSRGLGSADAGRMHGSAPAARQDGGRVALQRGPVVYCLEQVDNGAELNDVSLPAPRPSMFSGDAPGSWPACRCFAPRRGGGTHAMAGQALSAARLAPRPCTITAVPYFLWGNRAPGDARLDRARRPGKISHDARRRAGRGAGEPLRSILPRTGMRRRRAAGRRPPFLQHEQIHAAWEYGSFDEPLLAEVLRMADRIAGDPALLPLAWYACWRIFEGPRETQWTWPELRAYLGDDAGLFYLVVSLAFIPSVRAYHATLRIPEPITRDTCRQIACFLGNYRRGHNGRCGIYTTNVPGWPPTWRRTSISASAGSSTTCSLMLAITASFATAPQARWPCWPPTGRLHAEGIRCFAADQPRPREAGSRPGGGRNGSHRQSRHAGRPRRAPHDPIAARLLDLCAPARRLRAGYAHPRGAACP